MNLNDNGMRHKCPKPKWIYTYLIAGAFQAVYIEESLELEVRQIKDKGTSVDKRVITNKKALIKALVK